MHHNRTHWMLPGRKCQMRCMLSAYRQINLVFASLPWLTAVPCDSDRHHWKENYSLLFSGSHPTSTATWSDHDDDLAQWRGAYGFLSTDRRRKNLSFFGDNIAVPQNIWWRIVPQSSSNFFWRTKDPTIQRPSSWWGRQLASRSTKPWLSYPSQRMRVGSTFMTPSSSSNRNFCQSSKNNSMIEMEKG